MEDENTQALGSALAVRTRASDLIHRSLVFLPWVQCTLCRDAVRNDGDGVCKMAGMSTCEVVAMNDTYRRRNAGVGLRGRERRVGIAGRTLRGEGG